MSAPAVTGRSAEPRAPVELSVEEAYVSYGRAIALEDVSVLVRGGSVTGVVGPNGSGKTTLLRAISGLVGVQRGSVLFEGASVANWTPRAAARAGVIHVPEGRRMLRGLDVRDNLRVGALVGGLPEEDGIARVMSVFPELEPLLFKESSLLSGGEQQMVAIARGLMADPAVLMVDELSLGLAPRLVRRIGETLTELSTEHGLAVLVVDQSVEVLRRIVDSLYVLVNGRIGFHTDNPTEFASHVTNVYLGRHRDDVVTATEKGVTK